MKAIALIRQSRHLLEDEREFSFKNFICGAEWMRLQMKRITGDKTDHTSEHPQFNLYGAAKYLVSITAMLCSGFFFFHIHPALSLLSIAVFYLAEVQFLFLFPLIIDNSPAPLLASVKTTWRIGIFKAMVNVMFIGIFMLAGLFNFKNPLKNWYAGCLAVVIWYCDEKMDAK